MRQLHLPIFPSGVTQITDELAFGREDGTVTYFNGHLPVFCHPENDIATFRMITSQFCVNGRARQCDIIRAFGVTSISVKRAVKLYREKGPKGFYAARHARCGGAPRRRGGAGGAASCRRSERRGGCRDAQVKAQHPRQSDPRRTGARAG
jgi:hypothetical protein